MKKIILLLSIFCIILITACSGTKLPRAKNVNVHDIIKFGKYEQDGNEQNGKEIIDWLVLDKQDNKVLVISDKVLDNVRYGDKVWEESEIREWLNADFYNIAFTDAEKSLIETTKITDENKDTYDKVFLLSEDECHKYFEREGDRKCIPTVYAVNMGLIQDNDTPGYSKNGEGTSYWWLRSNDAYYLYAYVKGNGKIWNDSGREEYGKDSDSTIGLRPALWLNLK